MVIKPWGYAIWENIQRIMDGMFKETGHQNAYFPLFIPLSFLEKEAQHVEGFAKECAVVTHHRLEKSKDGKLVPAGPLDEPLIVRPTSETIIGAAFSKWVESYRDLPLLINQWCNIVRWEMRTRMFLRTTEILWQEGHTAHATSEEAREETMRMLGVYQTFVQDFLAVPVITGEKTPSERFPGAEATYTIEAMMQDRKALQSGTSHFLGQNFAKAFDIKFRDIDGETRFAWTTSWGSTTRLIGAMIMTHGDDNGLCLPPRIASAHIVLLPVVHKEETKAEVLAYCHALVSELKKIAYAGQGLRVIVDERDLRGGEKFWSWVKKGIPLCVEVGPRDIAADQFPITRRDQLAAAKTIFSRAQLVAKAVELLEAMQHALFHKAQHFRNSHIHKLDSKEDFYAFFTPKNRETPEIHGGFALAHWGGDPQIEEKVKEDLGVTIRCIPLDAPAEEGMCPFSGKKSHRRVIYAKAY
jgi:prolyl-tRNA synthetase